MTDTDKSAAEREQDGFPFGTEGDNAPEWMHKAAANIAERFVDKKRYRACRAEIVEALQNAANTGHRASLPPADPGAVAPKAFDAFLCRAWGETDMPSAELVSDWDGVRRFLIREWLGEEDEEVLLQVKDDFAQHEEDMGTNGGPHTITFEIGGVSIERVCGFSPPSVPSAPAAEVAQPVADALVRLDALYADLCDETPERPDWLRAALRIARGAQRGITVNAALASSPSSAQLEDLHGQLYTAQRFEGAQRDKAIGRARVIVHHLREGMQPCLTPAPEPDDTPLETGEGDAR